MVTTPPPSYLSLFPDPPSYSSSLVQEPPSDHSYIKTWWNKLLFKNKKTKTLISDSPGNSQSNSDSKSNKNKIEAPVTRINWFKETYDPLPHSIIKYLNQWLSQTRPVRLPLPIYSVIAHQSGALFSSKIYLVSYSLILIVF